MFAVVNRRSVEMQTVPNHRIWKKYRIILEFHELKRTLAVREQHVGQTDGALCQTTRSVAELRGFRDDSYATRKFGAGR